MTRQRRVLSGEFTRREALTRFALAAGVPLVPGLLAACTTQGSGTSSSSPAAAASSQPKSGGELRFSMFASDPKQLDPHQTVLGEDIYSVSPAYNNLVYLNFYDKPPYTIDPDLAESWEVTPDGKTYTFHLRKGVLFHDGSPFTAADAKYSLDRVRKPPSGVVSPRSGQLAMVDTTDTPDDYTLVVKLSVPSESFLPFLAQETMPIVPKHVAEAGKLAGTVVGTGPFKLDTWNKGQSITYVKNDKYFRPGLPYLDRVTRYIFSDMSLARAAFMAGQIDFMGRRSGELTQSEAKEIQARVSNVVMKPTGEMTEARIIMNSRRDTPFKDARVRQAVALWLDRKAVFDVIADGLGTVHGIVPSWDPGALPKDRLQQIAGFGSDLQANRNQAKRLLADAGFPNGFVVRTPLTNTQKGTLAVATAVMDQLRQLGVTGELQAVDSTVYSTRGVAGDWDLLMGANAYTMTNLEYVMREYFLANSGRNWGKLNNSDETTQRFNAYVAEADPAKKRDLGYQLQEAVMKLYAYVPIGTPGSTFVQHPYVRSYSPPYTQSTYDNLKFERVWLDK